MAMPRYFAKRFPGKGWAVVERSSRAKVWPEGVDHFMHSRRPVDLAVARLNSGRMAVSA